MRIPQKIEQWKEAGLISGEQASKILDFEERNPGRNWVVSGIAGIGVIALSMGVISIVAANWDFYSYEFKLLAYFALQIALGAGTWRYLNTKSVTREVLLTLFMALFLAGIGLISQIYNLRGEPYGGLFFWSAITFPTVLLSQSRLISNAWVILFGVALSLWVFDGREEERIIYGCAVVFLVLGLGAFRAPWYSSYFARAARLWSFLTLAAATVFAHTAWNYGRFSQQELAWFKESLPYIWFAALAPVATIALSRPPHPRAAVIAVACAMVALCFYLSNPIIGLVPCNDRTGAIFFLALWALIAAAAGVAGAKRIFDFATFVIGARFFVAYFEIFDSLGTTGIGLVGSGGFILGLLYVWHKYRNLLLQKISRKA